MPALDSLTVIIETEPKHHRLVIHLGCFVFLGLPEGLNPCRVWLGVLGLIPGSGGVAPRRVANVGPYGGVVCGPALKPAHGEESPAVEAEGLVALRS